MNEFLKTEYEQCLSLIKYYDERHHALVKYASGLSGAIPSLLLAIYQLGDNTNQYFWQFTLIISFLTALGLLSIFTVLIQTRLYFIYPVRQVNSIRRYSLKELNDSEFKNQMYLNTSFNAFKWSSSHTLLNLFIAMQVGVFAGLSMYSYMVSKSIEECIISTSLGLGLLTALILFGSSALYLFQNSKYHPDKSIHKEDD
ncbi:MAG: hypothetical protein L3J57_10740 [Desulfuromusa sp.]|nr:hypothetical protein [Desulfuromusa sp.]